MCANCAGAELYYSAAQIFARRDLQQIADVAVRRETADGNRTDPGSRQRSKVLAQVGRLCALISFCGHKFSEKVYNSETRGDPGGVNIT